MLISHKTRTDACTLTHGTRSQVATGTHGLIPSPASLHHHLEGMREQRLIGACPRGDPGGNTGDTDSRRRLQTHKQF